MIVGNVAAELSEIVRSQIVILKKGYSGDTECFYGGIEIFALHLTCIHRHRLGLKGVTYTTVSSETQCGVLSKLNRRSQNCKNRKRKRLPQFY